MAQDWDGSSYSDRFDKQAADTRAGYAEPRTFNRDGSTQAPASGGNPMLQWQALQAPQLGSVNPGLDYSYNSFLRGMGMQSSQIEAQKGRQTQYLDQQLADQRPLWADQLRTGLKGISDSAENNGMFRSGARLQDQNNFQNNQAEQQTAYENSIHRQQQELGASASDQLMNLARQKADQELMARQRVAQTQLQDQVNPQLMSFLQSALAGA